MASRGETEGVSRNEFKKKKREKDKFIRSEIQKTKERNFFRFYFQLNLVRNNFESAKTKFLMLNFLFFGDSSSNCQAIEITYLRKYVTYQGIEVSYLRKWFMLIKTFDFALLVWLSIDL